MNKKVTYAFSSNLKEMEIFLSHTLNFFSENAKLGDPGSELLFSLELTLREALVNAVKHGNKHDESKKVTLTAQIELTGYQIVVEDEGPGFNWKSAMSKAHPSTKQDHGRGLFLMRDYGLKMSWNQKGNVLTLFLPSVVNKR